MFADDINLHMSPSNVKTLQRKVKDEIQNIDRWIRANCQLITTKPVTLY